MHRFIFVALLSVAGCGDDETPGVDAGVDGARADSGGMDAGGADAARPDAGGDAGGGADAGGDGGAVDAGGDDGGAADAGGIDAAAMDGGSAPDAGACEYLDMPYIVSCTPGYLYLRQWTAIGGPPEACPEYWTLGDSRFDDQASALASAGCDMDCVRSASTSVSLLRCGVRTGYIVFRDPEDDCPEVLETPDGLFASREEWDAAFPCPP